jgi:hypothetical protein
MPTTVKLPEPQPFHGKLGEADKWLRHIKYHFAACGLKY